MRIVSVLCMMFFMSLNGFSMNNELNSEEKILEFHSVVKSKGYVRNGDSEKTLSKFYHQWFESFISFSCQNHFKNYDGDLTIIAEATFWLHRLMQSEIVSVFTPNLETFWFKEFSLNASPVTQGKIGEVKNNLLFSENEETVMGHALQQASFIIGRPINRRHEK